MKYAHENAKSTLSKSLLDSGGNKHVDYFEDDTDSDDEQNKVQGKFKEGKLK